MHGLTDAEVEAMLKESYDHALEDFQHRRAADLKTEIGIMLQAIEKNLGVARHGLDRETVLDLEDACGRARTAVTSGDVGRLQGARDELERASLPLATLLMDSVAKQALTGRTLDEV
jgi:hypothetical protein